MMVGEVGEKQRFVGFGRNLKSLLRLLAIASKGKVY